MKKLFYFLFMVLIPAFSIANTIPIHILKQYALTVAEQRGFKTQNLDIKGEYYYLEGSDTIMAIFTFSNSGYVVMSADDYATPVLAYSPTGDLDFNRLSPAFIYWMNIYKNQIVDARRFQLLPNELINNQWNQIQGNNSKNTMTVIVEPLIKSMWDQGKYYNQFSPVDDASPSGYDNRVPVGCVAVAMSSILYYYRYPATGQGFNTNDTEYGSFSVNFSQQHYDYDAMQDELNHYNSEVAKLIFHCATSVDMMYAADGSGAYSFDVPSALIGNFKYASSASLKNRSSSNATTWLNQIKNQLNNKKPIYYSGSSSEGGHAFVCDGYDSDDLCHFNFGWSGSGNGFFTLGTTTTSIGGYYNDQSMIIDIVPATYPVISNTPVLITSKSGTLEDGSRINNYADNSNITYIIAPPNATQFSVNIQSLLSESGNDTLTFWKGDPSNGAWVASYSGSVSNISLTISTDTLYITFKSNSSINDQGWRLSYNATTAITGCSQVQIFTVPTATITDGTPVGDSYSAESECSFLIRPTGAQNITLLFNRFDLSPEDYIEIYDITTTNKKHLDTYSGSTIPPAKTYSLRKIQVIFKSDNKSERDGFEMVYTINTNIDNTDQNRFNLYPNPSQDQCTLTLQEYPESSSSIFIYDAFGREINTFAIESQTITLDVSQYASGLYFVKIVTPSFTQTKKLVKN
jgi:hypothetical protein